MLNLIVIIVLAAYSINCVCVWLTIAVWETLLVFCKPCPICYCFCKQVDFMPFWYWAVTIA